MEAIEEKHETILASIVQDHDGDMQKFFNTVLCFTKKKTTFGLCENQKAKKLVIEAVEKHFESKTELARELTSFYCEVKCYKKVLSINPDFYLHFVANIDITGCWG